MFCCSGQALVNIRCQAKAQGRVSHRRNWDLHPIPTSALAFTKHGVPAWMLAGNPHGNPPAAAQLSLNSFAVELATLP